MARRRRPNYTGGRWRWRRRGIMLTQLTVKIRLHDLSPRHFQNISTISTHFHATIISRTALPLLSRPWRTSHLPSPSASSPPGNSKHQKGRLAGRLATPTPTLHTRLVSSLLTPKPPSTASKTSSPPEPNKKARALRVISAQRSSPTPATTWTPFFAPLQNSRPVFLLLHKSTQCSTHDPPPQRTAAVPCIILRLGNARTARRVTQSALS